MSLDHRTRVLEAITATQCGTRDLTRILACNTSKAIFLLKEMEEERLVESKSVPVAKRGRPKRVIICTPLGSEFLEVCRKARMKPLRARRADLERAVKDASYAQRLVARGHDVFKLFMELNMIARNIEESSETAEAAGRA